LVLNNPQPSSWSTVRRTFFVEPSRREIVRLEPGEALSRNIDDFVANEATRTRPTLQSASRSWQHTTPSPAEPSQRLLVDVELHAVPLMGEGKRSAR